MRVAEIGRQATLDAAEIGRSATRRATWLAALLGLVTVFFSVWYAREQIATAREGVGAQIQAAQKATVDQLNWQNEEHKRQVAFDLHREWSTETMLVTRTRAGKLLSNYPGSISQLEAREDPDEAARLWVVLNFFVRLAHAIETNQIDLKLVPGLFGDTFYWWYARFENKQLDKTGWESWEVVSGLHKWFEKDTAKDVRDQWKNRAQISPAKPLPKGTIAATSEQRRQTLKMHNAMYSTDFFVQVISPAWVVSSKWKMLTGKEGEQYRDTVVNGVCTDAHPLAGAKPDDPCLNLRDHFHGTDSLLDRSSEHVALSRFLSFFGNLWEYIDLELADRDLVIRLFKPMYGYFHPFVRDLRKAVEQHPRRYSHLPWIKQTMQLEDLFRLPHEPPVGKPEGSETDAGGPNAPKL